ncbi:hypothetical protein EON63_17445 [archaeon]|nr:MAG: hypothetical protein EON63_17445 [archaeon]
MRHEYVIYICCVCSLYGVCHIPVLDLAGVRHDDHLGAEGLAALGRILSGVGGNVAVCMDMEIRRCVCMCMLSDRWCM